MESCSFFIPQFWLCSMQYALFYEKRACFHGSINHLIFGDYLEISMTGLFVGHVSFDDFHRYQFSQWNFLFRKTIWNICHRQNQPLSGLDEYFCRHAFPRLILKKKYTSEGPLFLNAAPIFGPSAGTDKVFNIHPFCRQLVFPCTATGSYAFGDLTLKFRVSEKAAKIWPNHSQGFEVT